MVFSQGAGDGFFAVEGDLGEGFVVLGLEWSDLCFLNRGEVIFGLSDKLI